MESNTEIIPQITEQEHIEAHERLISIVGDIGITGLIGRIHVDISGRISTACWKYSQKTKDYDIYIGFAFLKKLDDKEIRFVVEHELLHHVSYQRVDDRSPLMSNVVLDIAVNKMLYLYDPIVTEQACKKIYNLEEIISTPLVLACPLLDANQIEKIGNLTITEEMKKMLPLEEIIKLQSDAEQKAEKLREMYIEIWGNRKTIYDFEQTVPSPLNLFYKLVEFIDVNVQVKSPFGEDSEEQSEQDGSDSPAQNQPQKTRNRCISISEEDESQNNDGQEEQDKQDESEKKQGAKKDDDECQDDEKQEDSSKNKSQGDEQKDLNEEELDGTNKNDQYSDFEKEIMEYTDNIAAQANQAGKQQSNIKFVFAEKPKINTKEIEKLMKERILEQTIDEIGAMVDGVVSSNIIKQPFITRPTRTTLTHIACGVTDYLPIYYNKRRGEGKPKIGCYVDISGSMERHMPLVHSIMVRVSEFLPSTTFVFHDTPMPMPTNAWQTVIPLGGGTDFNAVLQHACLSVEEKRKWFNKWTSFISPRTYHERISGTSVAALIQKHGMNADVVSEDYSVILMITDGEDQIDKVVRDKFLASNKTLLVLHLVNAKGQEHPFKGLAKLLYQINTNGKIIHKE